ncbi:uncharacterized protein PHACADRAFT_202002 [Phanerochaete carnosa HHB-10118-sp]|uniref:Uncharacterized protein n=1 Tax=Phanerochaete carnosa (strain HHB-10118-sp) TaxID=650164 RepID=K5WFY1_PHACS|nr:uncharacterized protein PHACADRAFT_202002 [Phanerochaete carnosa HHB-10118-sp]EKM49112.1 hypothetical protein PHACADRAFT_202002 [Phanerochaete carnosa HHB-10118-sp]
MHFILNLKSVHYVEELWISTDLGTDDTSLKKVDTIRAVHSRVPHHPHPLRPQHSAHRPDLEASLH